MGGILRPAISRVDPKLKQRTRKGLCPQMTQMKNFGKVDFL
jgi:hypothetical protein